MPRRRRHTAEPTNPIPIASVISDMFARSPEVEQVFVRELSVPHPAQALLASGMYREVQTGPRRRIVLPDGRRGWATETMVVPVTAIN